MDTEKRKQQKADAQRRWYQKNKEHAREAAKERYNKNKDAINTKRKEDRKQNPEKYREQAKHKYNPIKSKEYSWKAAGMNDMTYDRYLVMLTKQGHCCDLCGKHKSEFKRKLSVDHNHDTGEVRGLLCDACNGGLGKLRDSIEMLQKGINYLKRYDTSTC